VNPEWLKWKGRSLELDGYNAPMRLALEFSGPLHTKWTPSVEPYLSYFDRIVRDVVKRRMCAKRGVNLIVLDFTLPRAHWRDYFLSRLYDLKYITERPVNYIAEQIAEPFRNPQLEAELGLAAEMAAALAL
jgi:hypothetical protein